jgi:hypothetical protein
LAYAAKPTAAVRAALLPITGGLADAGEVLAVPTTGAGSARAAAAVGAALFSEAARVAGCAVNILRETGGIYCFMIAIAVIHERIAV